MTEKLTPEQQAERITHDNGLYALLHHADADAVTDAIAAALAEKDAEIAFWQICANCGEKMDVPGHCSNGAREELAGLESNYAEALDMRDKANERANAAESALTAAQARIARLEAALTDLRDYFAYGQREHTGMSAGAAPRCAPSVWNEIRRRVEVALRSTAEEARHE